MNAKSTFLPQEVIRHKRDGAALKPEDIEKFVRSLTDETLSEGQAAAFAMAVFFQGMTREEQVALTLAMRDSGDKMDWSDFGAGAPVVDKHSTGGVGDKVSLMLAPMVAAMGAYVPMISGRGLGHTGGTLDKFESVPGYNVFPDNPLFKKVVKDVGCAIIGQTANLAPADKRLYAIRDVTATVESIPLITASILSKKMAAGLAALVLDVKWGSGAFMGSYDEARALAANLASVATEGGLPTVALLTDMNEVLGLTAGNAIEMKEAIDFLTGTLREPRLEEVTAVLAAEMALGVGLVSSAEEGLEKVRATLTSGAAAEKFAAMVTALGGPADLLENPDTHLDIAPVAFEVKAKTSGFVSAMDVRAIGNAVVKLGGGRVNPTQKIDHSVGLSAIAGCGAEVGPDTPLCLIHDTDQARAEAVAQDILQAVEISPEKPPYKDVVGERIDGKELI
ncbi:MAG: thymidine phosphorylase [Alphaproteobacteria bacterium]|nr:MAG: thymidine phosphorylase [Alphaproteobacteria bacterium]